MMMRGLLLRTTVNYRRQAFLPYGRSIIRLRVIIIKIFLLSLDTSALGGGGED